MTEKKREELRRDASAHCEDMRDKFRDMIAAVKLVENLVSAGIEPNKKEQKAHDDAWPAVRRQRAGSARANDTRMAIAAANAAEAKAAKAAAVAEAKAAKAAAVAEARSAKAAAAREPRVLAVRAVLLRDRENGLAIPRIAEDVKAYAAFQNLTILKSRVMAVKMILQVQEHGRNLFKQTCPEDRAVGKLAKYGVVMSEIDADDERS
jgi:colicin import membrane protein